MVDETIHVMEANETTSEAFKNYAGAAWLVGMSVMAVAMGVGILSVAVKDLRKAKSGNMSDDLLAELRKRAAHSASSAPSVATASEALDSLKQAMDNILNNGPEVIDQVRAKEDTFYYVAKSYKEPITLGSMIPSTHLVKKSDTMTMEVFLKKDQLKFKSKTTTHVKGGGVLVTVEEILNSEPVKPV